VNQLAQIDLRHGELIVTSYSRTTAGFWVMNGKYARLRAGVDDHELGHTVDQALSASRDRVPVPPRRGPLPFAPVLDELQIDSYGSYMRGVRSVQVARSDAVVELMPMRNEGAQGGFVEIVENAEQLGSTSIEELGGAIRRAFVHAV
jgi:hypothetical protein